MQGSVDFLGVLFVIAALAALAAIFRRVSDGDMARGQKTIVMLIVLVIGGIMVWNLSLSFQR